MSFEVENILETKFLGLIEQIPNTQHSRISVLGYKTENNEYCLFNKSEITHYFSPEGKVFAINFEYEREGVIVEHDSLIEFYVTPSMKNTEYGGDDYIVNYDKNKYYSAAKVVPIIDINYQTSLENGFITQDELRSCMSEEQLNNIHSYFFIDYNSILYGPFRYDKQLKTVLPISGRHVKSYKYTQKEYDSHCIKVKTEKYFLGDKDKMPFRQDGIIDCMDDKQLGEWFKQLLKATANSEIFLELDKSKLNDFVTSNKETNDSIDEVRFERIKGKLDSLRYTFNELKELTAIDSTLTKSLNDSINSQKEAFQNEWYSDLSGKKEELESEISKNTKRNEELKNNISSLEEEFKNKKESLEKNYEETKEKLEKDIKDTQEKYDLLNSQFGELTSVLNKCFPALFSSSSTSVSNSSISSTPAVYHIEPYCYPTTDYPFEKENVSEFLNFNLNTKKAPEIFKKHLDLEDPFFKNSACFIPSASWGYLYAKAIRNAKLYNIHVEHDWLHFEDFMNHGLKATLESCYENESINHILLLDSLNLTQPECGLKPLLDVINNYSPILPVVNKPLPKNLKIFATIVPFDKESRIGLPLSSESFKNWAKIETAKDTIQLDSNFEDEFNDCYFFDSKDLQYTNIFIGDDDNNEYYC